MQGRFGVGPDHSSTSLAYYRLGTPACMGAPNRVLRPASAPSMRASSPCCVGAGVGPRGTYADTIGCEDDPSSSRASSSQGMSSSSSSSFSSLSSSLMSFASLSDPYRRFPRFFLCLLRILFLLARLIGGMIFCSHGLVL
jgi:hypothetical protein